MTEYRKCTIQRDDETKQVLLPDDQASIGRKIVIKDLGPVGTLGGGGPGEADQQGSQPDRAAA